MHNNTSTILVVDDEQDTLELIKMRLEREGYRVVQAQNGQEGLNVMKSSPLDLVIVNGYMPVMNGIELVNRMAEVSSLKAIPILFSTTWKEEANIEILLKWREKGLRV